MRGGERVLTVQVPAEEFSRVFTPYIEAGYDIVYIGCSLKQSGSVNTGTVVANKLTETHKDARIYCIDSLNASMSEGMLAVRAAQYRDEGMTADEINTRILAERKLVNEFCTVHSLDALTHAVRDAEINGVTIHAGDYFGYTDKSAVSAAKDKLDAAKDLTNGLKIVEHEYIIIIYGAGMTLPEREEYRTHLAAIYPHTELFEIDGGQEVYDLLIVLQ